MAGGARLLDVPAASRVRGDVALVLGHGGLPLLERPFEF
jgi:hypothetical protein